MPGSNFVRTLYVAMFFLTFTLFGLLSLKVLPVSRAQNISSPEKTIKPMTYPPARKSDQSDDYHGVKVPDPYRWLEDLDSDETKAWVEAENKLTLNYLNDIPNRPRIRDRLTKLWNYERYDTPFKEGGRYFYARNSGLQNQSVYYTVTSLTDEPKLLLDPNTLSADGTVALSGVAPSNDGKLMAYSL